MEVGEREEEEVKPLLFHRALSLRPANVCIRFVSYLSYREKSYFPVKNGERAWRKGEFYELTVPQPPSYS